MHLQPWHPQFRHPCTYHAAGGWKSLPSGQVKFLTKLRRRMSAHVRTYVPLAGVHCQALWMAKCLPSSVCFILSVEPVEN